MAVPLSAYHVSNLAFKGAKRFSKTVQSFSVASHRTPSLESIDSTQRPPNFTLRPHPRLRQPIRQRRQLRPYIRYLLDEPLCISTSRHVLLSRSQTSIHLGIQTVEHLDKLEMRTDLTPLVALVSVSATLARCEDAVVAFARCRVSAFAAETYTCSVGAVDLFQAAF